MKFNQTELPGVILVEPVVHRDERGFFLETYHADKYRAGGIDATFVQDNHSRSSRGILRGLHAQLIHPQDKLVRVVKGEIYDVAVDIRRGSPTFGKYVGVTLSAESCNQLFVPVGFAHGFAVLSEIAEVEYKCSDFYDPSGEISIIWNDPSIGIPWPISDPILSAKDAASSTLAELEARLPDYLEVAR